MKREQQGRTSAAWAVPMAVVVDAELSKERTAWTSTRRKEGESFAKELAVTIRNIPCWDLFHHFPKVLQTLKLEIASLTCLYQPSMQRNQSVGVSCCWAAAFSVVVVLVGGDVATGATGSRSESSLLLDEVSDAVSDEDSDKGKISSGRKQCVPQKSAWSIASALKTKPDPK